MHDITKWQPSFILFLFKAMHNSLVAVSVALIIFPLFLSCSDKEDNFQPSHADLLRLLRNERVGSAGPTSATPKSKPQTYLVSLLIVFDASLVYFLTFI